MQDSRARVHPTIPPSPGSWDRSRPDDPPRASNRRRWPERPRRRHDLLDGVFGDACVIFDPCASEVHSLEGTGSFVWSLLDGRRTVAEIVARLRETYDVGEDRARADVVSFLEDLRDRRLLLEGGDGAAGWPEGGRP